MLHAERNADWMPWNADATGQCTQEQPLAFVTAEVAPQEHDELQCRRATGRLHMQHKMFVPEPSTSSGGTSAAVRLTRHITVPMKTKIVTRAIALCVKKVGHGQAFCDQHHS